jgi:hypothetical protein
MPKYFDCLKHCNRCEENKCGDYFSCELQECDTSITIVNKDGREVLFQNWNWDFSIDSVFFYFLRILLYLWFI